MAEVIPATHIEDAHKLQADGRIDLYELTPAIGVGVLRFTHASDITWGGNIYTGIPVAMTGEKKTADGSASAPKMVIGQENINLSAFKPLISDGGLDLARITRHRVLRVNIETDTAISELSIFRVKRVESYSRLQIILQLASDTESMSFTLPFRQFVPPDFPSVSV